MAIMSNTQDRMNARNDSERMAAATVAPASTPKTLQEWVQSMLGGNPIQQAGGIQGQALGEAIPLFQPYQDAGLQGLNQFQQTSTPEGLDAMIAQIMGGDTFNSLVDQRGESITNQLSVGGLTRSGQAVDAAAQLPVDIAMLLEGLLSGRQGALADQGFGATRGIADLTTGVGEAIASGILGNEASKNARDASRDTNRSNLFGSLIGGGSTLAAASMFSDPRLKTNITKIDEIGPLNFYKWDWIPEAKGTVVEGAPTQGFLSTEVRDHYPDRVKTFGGFDMIDYGNLINDLRAA